MAAGHGGGEYKDLVVFLAAAGVVVPLFNRLKISPILGFLAAGVLLGPDGLARLASTAPWLAWLTIDDAAQIRALSELGVAFLLFMIGLELSWERLRAMRRLVFGLGMTQIAVCAAGLGALFMLMGQPLVSAAVLAMGLALSSTAVVMPVMAERGRLAGPAGRTTFSILLAQDLAVAPILITVTVLAATALEGATPAGEFDPAVLRPALLTLIPAALGLAVLVIVGRLVLRPMFRSVAKARARGQGQEMFVAASLLVVVASGLAAQAVGLSMSLGALIAGLLLAETEFRREVEVSIEPFKGLLLGVFFVGVGIGLDLDAVAADPGMVLGLALGITTLKAVLIYLSARAWKVRNRTALETALVLGPAGEFAFVILGAGMVEGVASPAFTGTVMLAATISIFTIPLMALLADRLVEKVSRAAPDLPEEATTPGAAEGRVLIVGYGRVGRLVGELLTDHGQGFLAVDSDPSVVSAARAEGVDVSWGDAARVEFLERCDLDHARAVVVTMDAPGKVDEVVRSVRAAHPDLCLIARARDEKHAVRLYELGATDAVPETTEASLQLAENTLVDVGVPMGLVLASIHERRDVFRRAFQEARPEGGRTRPARALRAAARPGD
ncbi:MAG: cation:proton antiporter [Alphaproteobacteria bacterium]|nr:cation:proton antiporter [Alphaproteobacteria bacterium]MBU1526492.1 cation:proton antiporter [Alphaproteobacteria bacterium]MBU2116462.1 cation:proton antiporter [Alphaproteobacteria bacterium]MBU2350290.1 cation:proton antiporter [Alphaproteobacteria bacterium]MBU2381270.1 cation:proton antiporter [Alphaproteobacteria bacterium]